MLLNYDSRKSLTFLLIYQIEYRQSASVDPIPLRTAYEHYLQNTSYPIQAFSRWREKRNLPTKNPFLRNKSINHSCNSKSAFYKWSFV